MKKSICILEIGLLLLLSLVFSLATGLERQQQRISDSMVRLHVVAASDQKLDQDIKLKVGYVCLKDIRFKQCLFKYINFFKSGTVLVTA